MQRPVENGWKTHTMMNYSSQEKICELFRRRSEQNLETYKRSAGHSVEAIMVVEGFSDPPYLNHEENSRHILYKWKAHYESYWRWKRHVSGGIAFGARRADIMMSNSQRHTSQMSRMPWHAHHTNNFSRIHLAETRNCFQPTEPKCFLSF